VTQWIDFKLLKQQLSFETVLAHYDVESIPDGPSHVKCKCPFHDDAKPSLGVDLSKKIWQCFACKASGNVLDFVTRMEGFDPAEKGAIRKGAEAAMLLISSEASGHEKPPPLRTLPAQPQPKISTEELVENPPTACALDEENTPLNFELKLEIRHAFLKGKGLKRATLERFGVGVAKRGLMKNRVCFPLRNGSGQLLGYAGRWASNDLPEDTPLWQFPPKFNLARFVFGLDQFPASSVPQIVLTHEFWSVLALYEAGYPAVCVWALNVRLPHTRLLLEHGIDHVVILDPDDEEVSPALPEAVDELSRCLFVRTITADELGEAFQR